MRHVLIALLKAYRFAISPLYGNVCRYWPTCSAYALRSVEVHGAARGTWLTLRRLARCHPWAIGGYDPVPGTPEATAWAVDPTNPDRADDAGHGPSHGHDGRACRDHHPDLERDEVTRHGAERPRTRHRVDTLAELTS